MMLKSLLRFLAYLFVLSFFSASHADSSVDFFRAVNVDNDRTVRELLKAGFDPNTRNPQGQVGLFLALREESLKAAAALIEHPAIVIDATSPADETPLMMACLRGNTAFAMRLLERGAALNRPGWTALHYAASGPQTPLVALLLDRGADIDAQSPTRMTALMLAARYGPHETAELLLKRGADTKLRDDRQRSAADLARGAGRERLAAQLEAAPR